MWYGGSYKNPRPDRMTVTSMLSSLHYSTRYPKPEAISQERWGGMMKWIKTRMRENDDNLAKTIAAEMSIQDDWG